MDSGVGGFVDGFSDNGLTPPPPAEDEAQAQVQAQAEAEEQSPGTLVQSPKSQRAYRIYGPKDARRTRPPIVPLVEGIIQPSSLGIWVGTFGVGKTWALLDMAVCMAMGKPWLGYPVKQGGVLLIDEESGERRLSDRVQMVLDAHGAPDDAPLHYTCFNSFNFFTDDKSGDDLAWLVKQFNVQMVVIDALTDVSMPAKEKDSEEMGLVLKTLKLVTDLTGASVQLLHHENKQGEYRGSTNIPALVDVALSVKSDKRSNVLDFSFIKARDVAQFEFAAAMNFTPGKFWMSPHGTSAKAIVLSRPQKHVMRFLQEHGGSATVKDIVTDPETCTEKSARGAVYELASKGLIRRVNEGGKGEGATYAIVKADQEWA